MFLFTKENNTENRRNYLFGVKNASLFLGDANTFYFIIATNFPYVVEHSLLIASGPENYFEMLFKK